MSEIIYQNSMKILIYVHVEIG